MDAEQGSTAAGQPAKPVPTGKPAPGAQRSERDLAIRELLQRSIRGEPDEAVGAGAAVPEAQDAVVDGRARNAEDLDAPGSERAAPDQEGASEADSEAAEGGGAQAQELTSIDDVAAKLGISKQELNKVSVKVGDQELTLGELKAKLPALAKLDADRVELAERRSTWELTRIDQERKLIAVADTLPAGALPPGFLRALDDRQRQTLQREATLLGSARPGWRDPVYAASQRKAIADAMEPYGFSDAELGAVSDHRIVLAMQDYAELRAQVAAAKQAARKVDAAAPGRAGQAETSGSGANNRRTGNQRAELNARVAAVMRRNVR